MKIISVPDCYKQRGRAGLPPSPRHRHSHCSSWEHAKRECIALAIRTAEQAAEAQDETLINSILTQTVSKLRLPAGGLPGGVRYRHRQSVGVSKDFFVPCSNRLKHLCHHNQYLWICPDLLHDLSSDRPCHYIGSCSKRLQKKSFRTLAIEIARKFQPASSANIVMKASAIITRQQAATTIDRVAKRLC